ncbi:MAG: hypothetical protein V8Q84_09495 [Bilophila sp.]
MGSIVLSVLLAVLNYLILIGYDWLALKAIHKSLPLSRVSLVSPRGAGGQLQFSRAARREHRAFPLLFELGLFPDGHRAAGADARHHLLGGRARPCGGYLHRSPRRRFRRNWGCTCRSTSGRSARSCSSSPSAI